MVLRLFLLIAVIALGFCSIGCASIIRGSEQEIFFTSNPSGATVEVEGKIGRTPCGISLYRKKDHEAIVEYNSIKRSIMLYSKWDLPWYAGLYDLFTASVYSLSPEKVHIDFNNSDK